MPFQNHQACEILEWKFTHATTADPKLCDNPHISFADLTTQCCSSRHLSVTDCQSLEVKSDTVYFFPL